MDLNIDYILAGLPDKHESKTTTSLIWKRDLINYIGTDFLDKKVIELGSSSGATTRVLSFLFKHVTAVDILSDRHEASKKLNADRDNIDYIIADIYNSEWKFDTDTDVVVIDCIHTFNHVRHDIIKSLQYFNKKILIIFDDYGLCPEVRDGINSCIQSGLIEPITKIGAPKGTEFAKTVHKILTDQEGIICKAKQLTTYPANISNNQQLKYNYHPVNGFDHPGIRHGAIWPVLHLLQGKKDIVAAEIGVWRADSSLALLEHCDIKKLYLIDPWDSTTANSYNSMDPINSNIPSIDYVKSKLEKHLDKIVFIQKTSDDAHYDIPDNELDFIWIDGAHDYTSVYKDMVHYYPKVKMNGIIAGDDFTNKQRQSGNFYVIEAVNDVLGGLGYTELDLYKHRFKPEDYYSAFAITKTIEAALA